MLGLGTLGLGKALLLSAGAVAVAAGGFALLGQGAATAQTPVPDHQRVLTQYCQGCHNDKTRIGNFSVQQLRTDNLAANDAAFEKVLRKIKLGEMPPRGMPAPPKQTLTEFTSYLSTTLDRNAAASPNPGRAVLRRLNRVEYANAVRDLLDLKIDVSKGLPADDSGHGFDNIAEVLTFSPTLMDRYIRVAGKVSRMATGQAPRSPATTDFKPTQDELVNQRAHDSLPLDSRAGGAFEFYAPYDATYRLTVDINQAQRTETRRLAENRIQLSVPLTAGLHTIGASFPRNMVLEQSLVPLTPQTMRGPKPTGKRPDTALDIHVDGVRVKRQMVAPFSSGVIDTGELAPTVIYGRDLTQISVQGPFGIKGPGNTPSRRKIFTCRPSAAQAETACARSILSRLARQAYRRPVTDADMAPLMKMYAEGRKDGGFEPGIQAAIEMVLISPHFLFVRENDAAGARPGAVSKLSDLELATRLSLFLWSSIPDAQLLQLAEKGQLSRPAVLQREVTRMLADPRASALTDNFAGQWLYLRRLEFQTPDRNAFPGFDNRLRAAMLTETNMFFDSVVRENRSALDFIGADYTFLNQRLAEHYGIGGVYGTTFRKVKLDPAFNRGGLLGQGSILTVTSYNDRTSIVLRGKWILDNLLAAPPPPPPANVPALEEVKNANSLSARELMEAHRANPVCASCHSKMDPLGFAMENFDAIGGWRKDAGGKLINASATMPDGTKFDGPKGLSGVLMNHKDEFIEAFTERLMIYALGRGVEAYDMPAIRAVRAAAAKDDYRIHSIIMGIVQSVPFSMRRTSQNDDRT
ncbi:MAG TPA: DUF1592 domain-containing protein [Rhizomicrobium sp.]|nr:DUF1592 domain-containing protein [Rhizomicrobium sp.]